MTWHVEQGDCREVCRRIAADTIDAVVTDSPYGLGFMNKGWDHEVPGVEFWSEFLRIAKPGAHLVAFGGPRKAHRLTVAIEDAGWEIRDSLSWLYGSGFPKSLNFPGGLGTALKPAHEPIVLARKPLSTTVEKNLALHGTGVLNIDACRIAVDESDNIFAKNPHTKGGFGHAGAEIYGTSEGAEVYDPSKGRWPANLLLDEVAAEMLDEQTGVLRSSPGKVLAHHAAIGFNGNGTGSSREPVGDSGGASRFFYVAKPSTKERDLGLEHLEATWVDPTRAEGSAGRNNPRAGAGRKTLRKNIHPTVKPIDVMEWLCRLVTPRGGLVLDPFCGSGTTGIAARRAGFLFLGIDLEETYVKIARGRIEAALR